MCNSKIRKIQDNLFFQLVRPRNHCAPSNSEQKLISKYVDMMIFQSPRTEAYGPDG